MHQAQTSIAHTGTASLLAAVGIAILLSWGQTNNIAAMAKRIRDGEAAYRRFEVAVHTVHPLLMLLLATAIALLVAVFPRFYTFYPAVMVCLMVLAAMLLVTLLYLDSVEEIQDLYLVRRPWTPWPWR